MVPEATRISVVIPAYNAAWCIGRAIDSVLAQTLPALEILVVDDGSTDNTRELLGAYGETIRVIHKENGGLSSARNAGIVIATGSLIAFLDADDWWLPGKLAQQAELMHQHPEIGFCSVVSRVESPDGDLLNLWECPKWKGSFLETLFHHHAAVAGSGSGVMVRGELFNKAGLFNENLKSLEDIDMWMRLAAISGYACLSEPLAVILKHPDSMSCNLAAMKSAAIQIMKDNRHLLPRHLRGSYWRAGLAGVFTDYAKWEYRTGKRGFAVINVLRAVFLAPIARGQLCLGLLKDILLKREL